MSDAHSTGTASAIDPVTVFVYVEDCTIVLGAPRLLLPRAEQVRIRWVIVTDGWSFVANGVGIEGVGNESGARSVLGVVNAEMRGFRGYSLRVQRPKEEPCLEIETSGFAIVRTPVIAAGSCDLTIQVGHKDNAIHVSQLHAGAGTNRPMTIEWKLNSDSYIFAANGIEFINSAKFTMIEYGEDRICYRNANDDTEEYKYNITLVKKCDPSKVVYCDPGIKNGSG